MNRLRSRSRGCRKRCSNGVVTRKNSPDILMSSCCSDDSSTSSTSATMRCCRCATVTPVDGAGDIQMFGARDYSMRLWLDPDRSQRSVDFRRSGGRIRAQNLQIAGGQPGAADRRPAFAQSHLYGRLKDQKQFEDIVAGRPRQQRLRDVARVNSVRCPMRPTAFVAQTAVACWRRSYRDRTRWRPPRTSRYHGRLKTCFPKGLDYHRLTPPNSSRNPPTS